MAPGPPNDPYGQLGVRPNATTQEISEAFRRRAKELHPDLHPADQGAHDRFQALTQAYDTLVRPDRRAIHDAQTARRQAPAGTPHHVQPTLRAEARTIFRTPRRARTAAWGGSLIALLGLVGTALLVALSPSGDATKTITLWIVAIKLLVCGLALGAAGVWRLRHFRQAGTN